MEIRVFVLLLALAPFAASATWSYESAYRCLRALATGLPLSDPPAIFNSTGTGVLAGSHGGTNGFFVVTPTVPYFFPREEMSRSGDGASQQTKIAVITEHAEPRTFKIFYNPEAGNPRERILFGTTNEFDRHVELSPADGEGVRVQLSTAVGGAFLKARLLLPSHKKQLSLATDLCAETQLDFKLDLGDGTDSTFRTEVVKLQKQMRPGVFTLEYWFPKESSAN